MRETADLARLDLSDEECARLEPELDSILEHFKALSELDLEGVEGTASVGLQDVTRPDVPQGSMDPETLLARAPRERDSHYQVPRAVGGSE
ncbi:MAG: Asp-tRNA(Asn)/Glu-tRNA(Gln) amidotransferase subunit GatC [Planctomycetes bacterium]|nr:Asp-tRNA(Asn)/Glu-tRNA(Gln) amidotransferase subunit GatC [Planctomycetota bacterium]